MIKYFERERKKSFLPFTVSLTQQISLDKIDSPQFSSTSCNGQQFLQSVKHATHVVDEYSHGPDEDPSSNSIKKNFLLLLHNSLILHFILNRHIQESFIWVQRWAARNSRAAAPRS